MSSQELCMRGFSPKERRVYLWRNLLNASSGTLPPPARCLYICERINKAQSAFFSPGQLGTFQGLYLTPSHLKVLWNVVHRCLQSCVGTRARLGYATFDAQLRKRIVSTLYAIRTSVHA